MYGDRGARPELCPGATTVAHRHAERESPQVAEAYRLTASTMFTVIYRWEVKPKMEEAFRRAWHHRTEKIYATRNSFGSRLHRECDGTLCAIALWPSQDAWRKTEPPLLEDDEDAATFRDAIAKTLPTMTMDMIDDLWKVPTA